jgi:hypothetical protein
LLLWLDSRIARYQARIARSGIAQIIDNTCTAICIKIHSRATRQQRAGATPAATLRTVQKLWAENWAGALLKT